MAIRTRSSLTNFRQVRHCVTCPWVWRYGLRTAPVCAMCGGELVMEVGRVQVTETKRHFFSDWEEVNAVFIPRALKETSDIATAGAICKIMVPTEYDKQQLLLASRYIHDLASLDIGFDAVNTLAHVHQAPFLIEVVEPQPAVVAEEIKA